MKKYVVIAGVNGAGKSTLYQTDDNLKNLPRVNVDEIIKEIGDWKNTSDIFTAGKIAVKNITEYLKNGELIRISSNVPKWFSKVKMGGGREV